MTRFALAPFCIAAFALFVSASLRFGVLETGPHQLAVLYLVGWLGGVFANLLYAAEVVPHRGWTSLFALFSASSGFLALLLSHPVTRREATELGWTLLAGSSLVAWGVQSTMRR